MGELLDTVNPTTGDDWAISEVSFDEVMNEAIFQLCLRLGLRGSSNILVQTSIAIISYATLMEGFQHALGIGAGFAKVDLNGKRKLYFECIYSS